MLSIKLLNKRLLVILISSLNVEIFCIMISSLGNIRTNIPKFSFFYSASFIAYTFAVSCILRSSIPSKIEIQNFASQSTNMLGNGGNNSKKIFWIILVFSMIFRLTLLPITPSDDVYRYLWEGKLQLNGINPYSYAPGSSNLEHLRDNFFSGINHKNLTTIYPPLTLIIFAIADFVSHSLISIKSFFLLFDVFSIFILTGLLKAIGREPVNVLIYAWNPLVLISFAGEGHCDSLQIFFVILALYLYLTGNSVKSVISIGLAVMSKFVSIFIVPPLILKNKRKYLIILFAVITFLYLPYINAGKRLVSTLFHFSTQNHYNDSIHFLFLCLSFGSPFLSKTITLIIFSIVFFFLYKKYHDNILRFAFLVYGSFLILAPTVHPWYLTWIVPFLCFYHSKAWLVLTGTVIFYYFMNHSFFSKLIEYNNELVWREVHWLKLPEYLPFYFLLIYEFLKNRLPTGQINCSVFSKK